jgi:hypothetical protein
MVGVLDVGDHGRRRPFHEGRQHIVPATRLRRCSESRMSLVPQLT